MTEKKHKNGCCCCKKKPGAKKRKATVGKGKKTAKQIVNASMPMMRPSYEPYLYSAHAEGERQRFAPKNEVTIPAKEFVKEHVSLVDILKSGTKSEQQKEATSQQKELKKVMAETGAQTTELIKNRKSLSAGVAPDIVSQKELLTRIKVPKKKVMVETGIQTSIKVPKKKLMVETGAQTSIKIPKKKVMVETGIQTSIKVPKKKLMVETGAQTTELIKNRNSLSAGVAPDMASQKEFLTRIKVPKKKVMVDVTPSQPLIKPAKYQRVGTTIPAPNIEIPLPEPAGRYNKQTKDIVNLKTNAPAMPLGQVLSNKPIKERKVSSKVSEVEILPSFKSTNISPQVVSLPERKPIEPSRTSLKIADDKFFREITIPQKTLKTTLSEPVSQLGITNPTPVNKIPSSLHLTKAGLGRKLLSQPVNGKYGFKESGAPTKEERMMKQIANEEPIGQAV